MTRGFPTYSKAAQKGDRGVDIVSRVINEEFEWLFKRNHQEHDFGIDAQVDVVLEDGAVTGQMLALQIKYGSTFFSEKNKWGYIFRGEQKHFNYLANYPTPVLIIICDPGTNDCYWVHFDPKSTSKAGNNWKITIPFTNKLQFSKDAITDLLPPPSDYLSEVENYWAMNDIIVNHKYFLFIIDRVDVDALDFSNVRGFFDRIRSTREIAEHCQGKIEISFHGYDQDPRELYEVPEVRVFASGLSAALPELLFFVFAGERSHGLKTISLCLTEVKRLSSVPNADNKIPVEVSTEKIAQFLDELWPGLNELTEWLNMTVEENKRITFDVMRALGFSPPSDEV
ncbi:DUF4365 and DUF1817 domain-containing protein [Pseudomonas orientalis]|uniref:DUF4365 and DUF1817 domain-containing protein n=1 Tax=Pseudomonas orientalis TaxID=76758 RepID=UPI0010231BCB|nr:DUF4365 and DUF1817 domain-containing protein [Pseudomonas orientalis]RZI26808.1 DUF4365 and DUF1817 domain-containing protein [Pseudomonas orientalis]